MVPAGGGYFQRVAGFALAHYLAQIQLTGLAGLDWRGWGWASLVNFAPPGQGHLVVAVIAQHLG